MIDGSSRIGTLARIVLPLAMPGLLSAGIFAFTLSWNEFIYSLVFITTTPMKTLPVGIAAFTPVNGTRTQLEGFALAMAGVTLLSVPSVALFAFLQKYFVQGLRSGAVRG